MTLFKKYFLVEAMFFTADNNKKIVMHLVRAKNKVKAEFHVKTKYEEKREELDFFPEMIKARNTMIA